MPEWCQYDRANISQTYVALCSLLILGDDLKGVDKEAILFGVSSCQLEDGRYADFVVFSTYSSFLLIFMIECTLYLGDSIILKLNIV